MPQEIIPFFGGNSINLQKIQATQILKKKEIEQKIQILMSGK